MNLSGGGGAKFAPVDKVAKISCWRPRFPKFHFLSKFGLHGKKVAQMANYKKICLGAFVGPTGRFFLKRQFIFLPLYTRK